MDSRRPTAVVLRKFGAKRPRLIFLFLFPENFFYGFERPPETALTVFHPVKRVVRALWRQLDSCAAPLAADKKWTQEVHEGVIPKTLFALLLRCRFWSPVDEAALWELAHICQERGNIITSTSLGLWEWYIPCRAAQRVRCFLMDVSPAQLNRVNGRTKRVTSLDLRHTRREGRAWFTAPGLEWRMNEAMEEHRPAGGVKFPTSKTVLFVTVLSLPWIGRR